MSPARPSPLAWAMLLVIGLVWGGSFLGISLALEGFGPITVAALRIAIAALILGAAAVVTGVGLPPTDTQVGRRIWLHCFGMAALSNALPFSFLAWGQQYVSTGFAGIMMAILPLVVLPLAHVFVPGEQMTRRRVTGFLIGFGGTVLLVGPAAGTDAGSLVARLACLAAPCCYAMGAIVTRRAPAGPHLAFGAASLILATVMIVPLALLVEGVPQAVPATAWAGAAYLGVLATALATVLVVWLIHTAGPSFLSLVNYQVPIWAVLIGMIVLGEALPTQFLGALALILTGLAVSQTGGRKAGRIARPESSH